MQHRVMSLVLVMADRCIVIEAGSGDVAKVGRAYTKRTMPV